MTAGQHSRAMLLVEAFANHWLAPPQFDRPCGMRTASSPLPTAPDRRHLVLAAERVVRPVGHSRMPRTSPERAAVRMVKASALAATRSRLASAAMNAGDRYPQH